MRMEISCFLSLSRETVTMFQILWPRGLCLGKVKLGMCEIENRTNFTYGGK